MKTKLGLLILMLMTSIGCRSDSPAAPTEEEHTQTSPSKQKAVRENTLVLTDFEKDETVFSFQGGGLLKLMAKEDLEKADLWLAMPHGMASNNSQLDNALTMRVRTLWIIITICDAASTKSQRSEIL